MTPAIAFWIGVVVGAAGLFVLLLVVCGVLFALALRHAEVATGSWDLEPAWPEDELDAEHQQLIDDHRRDAA